MLSSSVSLSHLSSPTPGNSNIGNASVSVRSPVTGCAPSHVCRGRVRSLREWVRAVGPALAVTFRAPPAEGAPGKTERDGMEPFWGSCSSPSSLAASGWQLKGIPARPVDGWFRVRWSSLQCSLSPCRWMPSFPSFSSC